MAELPDLQIDPERVIRNLATQLTDTLIRNAQLEAAITQLVTDKATEGNTPPPENPTS